MDSMVRIPVWFNQPDSKAMRDRARGQETDGL
jgi:hypothetical protein